MSKHSFKDIELSLLYVFYNNERKVMLISKHILSDTRDLSGRHQTTLHVAIVLSNQQMKVIRKYCKDKSLILLTFQNFLSIFQNCVLKGEEYDCHMYRQLGLLMFPLLQSIPRIYSSDEVRTSIQPALTRLVDIILDTYFNKANITGDGIRRELSVLPCIYKMQQQGIKLDYDGFIAELLNIERELESSLVSINNMLGVTNNSQNFNMILQDHIEKSQLDDEVVQQIKRYNQCKKILTTYGLDKQMKYLDGNGYLRCHWNSFGTKSGRITTTLPNLQGYPKRLRNFWIPEEGNVHIWGDYVSEEFVLLAYLAKEDKLIKAIKDGADFHKITASDIFKCPEDMLTEEQRVIGKKVNFSILYGAGYEGLQNQLHGCGIYYSKEEVIRLKDSFFETNPGINEYQKKLEGELKLQSVGGKTWYSPNLPPKYKRFNMIIQSSGADILKEVLIELNYKLPKTWKLKFCIHDSILLEVPSCDCKEASKLLKQIMQEGFKRLVPNASYIPVDIKVKI